VDLYKIRAIAWDIDGTLFSSEDILLDIYIKSIDVFNQKKNTKITIPSKDRLFQEVGKPVKTIFRNLLPELSEDDRDEISNSVLQLLCEDVKLGKGHVYEGVPSTLQELHTRGYQFVAASNGRFAYVNEVIERIQCKELFKPIRTLNPPQIKDKNELLDSLLKEHQWKPEEVLMVGDRLSDFDASRYVGCPFAFASYGHAPPGEIQISEIYLKSIQDLLVFFKGIT
jgi:phosphoglycolate phosphatase